MAFSLGSATRQGKEEETETKASKTSTGYFYMLSNKCYRIHVVSRTFSMLSLLSILLDKVQASTIIHRK